MEKGKHKVRISSSGLQKIQSMLNKIEQRHGIDTSLDTLLSGKVEVYFWDGDTDRIIRSMSIESTHTSEEFSRGIEDLKKILEEGLNARN